MTPLPDLAPGERPPPGATVLVHIGKCGGSSLRMALQDADIQMWVAHVIPPPVADDLRYVICLRHPVARALSAFNWRRKLVIEDGSQANRFPGERAVLERYETLDALARALPGAASDYASIHHLREGIAFYLGDLLDRIAPEQVAAVVLQECLDADIARCFGLRHDYRVHDHAVTLPAERTRLGPGAEMALRAHLAADFACIERLHAWGKIDTTGFALVHATATRAAP